MLTISALIFTFFSLSLHTLVNGANIPLSERDGKIFARESTPQTNVGKPNPNALVLERLLLRNEMWAQRVESHKPGFFSNSTKGQLPKVMYVGCSDSRVPEGVITDVLPGEIFVQRNIANQVNANDPNAVSAISYAVSHLNIDRVVITGHTRCGGVAFAHQHAHSVPLTPGLTSAALPPLPDPTLDSWLNGLYKMAFDLRVGDQHGKRDDHLATDANDGHGGADNYPPSLQLLERENVKVQVDRTVALPAIQEAWKQGRDVAVFGWLYDISTGRLQDLGYCAGKPGSVSEAMCQIWRQNWGTA